jgi:uncharacterized protein (TIGR03435 family)
MPHLRGLGWVSVILAGRNWKFHDAKGSLPLLCVGPVDRKLETLASWLREAQKSNRERFCAFAQDFASPAMKYYPVEPEEPRRAILRMILHKEFHAMIRFVRQPLGWLAAFLVLLYGAWLHAQTPIVEEPNYKPTLTFDVASIRLAPPPDAHFHVTVSSPPHSSRFEATNLPIKALLQIAYGFDAPVVGAPDWVANTFYDIKARSDEAADARLATLPVNEVRLEKRNAIRVLLAKRFEFKTHLETRNTSLYHLMLAKGGIKMEAVPAPPPPANGAAAPAPPPADTEAHGSQHGLEFDGTNASMRAICGALSSMVEAPVVDQTGLTGTYDYKLQFGREWSANDPDSWPSIFTAVQEQLGLKLEAVHESVPNLVVDHIAKPTEN